MMAARRRLLVLFLALTPFQDTVLRQSPLGYLGTSLAVIPLMALAGMDLLDFKKITTTRIGAPLLAALAYAALASLVALLWFGTAWAGASLVSKTAVLFACTGIALYSVVGLDYGDVVWLRRGCFTAFFLCLTGILLGDLNLFGLDWLVRNGFFHAGNEAGDRWRGFSSEASTLSLTVVSLGLLCAFLSRSKISRAMCLFTGLFAVAMTHSKGGIATLVMAVIATAVMRPRAIPSILLASLAATPMLWLALANFQSIAAEEMLSETTTLATRSVLAVWSCLVVKAHPLGVGFGGFYPALTEYLPAAMDSVYGWSPYPLNFSEVAEYRQSGQYASTKSLLLNYTVYFGLPFLAAATLLVWRLTRWLARRGETVLCLAVLFVSLALAAYVESPFVFVSSIVYGRAWRMYEEAQNFACNE